MPWIPPPREPDLVFPCSGAGHRVRLAVPRYWKDARCPTCQAPVDPRRQRRLARWLQGGAPASRLRVGRARVSVIGLLAIAALAYAVVLALAMHGLGDRHWVGTVLLFSGRWVWLVPALALLVLVLLVDRRWWWTPVLALWVLVTVVMGFRTGWRRLLPGGDGGVVRVLTFNVEGGQPVSGRLAELVRAWTPDVVALQECSTAAARELAEIPGYQAHGQRICVASRFPVDSILEMPRRDLEGAGGAGLVVTYRLRTPTGPIAVTALHLETPREGLERLLQGAPASGLRAVRANTMLRDIESRLARRWADQERGPHLVVGDFNTPVESVLFDRHWSGLANAWDHAGTGFGYTKKNGWIRARIDHILASPEWTVRDAWVGADYGSDHLPLIADLALAR